jgi:hypothetical protein
MTECDITMDDKKRLLLCAVLSMTVNVINIDEIPAFSVPVENST